MRFSPTPWFIASLAFVVLGFSRGIHSSFGVFNVALLDTFGWSRGATAGIFSIVLTVDAVLSPLVGYLLDRYGTKKISIAGCVALVIGLFLSSQVSASGSFTFASESFLPLVSLSPAWCRMYFWSRSGFPRIGHRQLVSFTQALGSASCCLLR
jgi:MFS family permease